jgi:RNase P subunit RPR2
MEETMIDLQEDLHQVSCPRCRGEAEWRFLDDSKATVEVMCADCGRFEMPREEFEQAESDITETEERRD